MSDKDTKKPETAAAAAAAAAGTTEEPKIVAAKITLLCPGVSSISGAYADGASYDFVCKDGEVEVPAEHAAHICARHGFVQKPAAK